MFRSVLLLTTSFVCGCDSDPTDLATHQSAVAIIDTNNDKAKIGFTSASRQDRLPEAISGLEPRDFEWIVITIEPSRLEAMKSDSGLRVDLRDVGNPANVTTFEQVYIGPCNPALSDFRNCYLYENITTGGIGVSGFINLRLHSKLDTEYDVVIEGQTDRFGAPVQWHKHGSIGSITADVKP